jgi:hypothetical protein
MESSFIPNLNPAIGRTSTPSSARSKKPSECGRGLSAPIRGESISVGRWVLSVERWTLSALLAAAFGVDRFPRRSSVKLGPAFSLQSAIQRADREASCREPSRSLASWTLRLFNAQRSTLNAQRSIQTVECWALDVGRWTFSFSRRVKGAWWPSRSSKPLLIRQLPDQGRFDSYPLRIFINVCMGFSPSRRLYELEVQPMFHRQDADATSSKGGERMSREQIRRLTSLSSCAG